MTCSSCGAAIDPGALKCTFCGAPTQAAAIAAEAARARAAQQEAARLAAEATGRARLEALGRQSLVWSLFGIGLCCMPIGVVGIVQASRARSLAAEVGAPVPSSARAALWVGILSTAFSVGFVAWALVRSDRLADQATARIAELARETKPGAAAATLDARTACGLGEMHALKVGWSGQSGREFGGFECPGAVLAVGDRAALTSMRFSYQSSTAYDVHVCFERGGVWSVKELRKDACAVEGEARRKR